MLKQILRSIEKQILEKSLIQNIFDMSIIIYKNALAFHVIWSIYHLKMTTPYILITTTIIIIIIAIVKKTKIIAIIIKISNNYINNNNQKIMWSNPPYLKSLKTDVEKIFVKLLSKHFPGNHRLHKKSNRNTVKIS